MQRTVDRMDLADAHQPWERELIHEFGLNRAIQAVRQFPTPAKARAYLEAEREALQVQRWRNIKL